LPGILSKINLDSSLNAQTAVLFSKNKAFGEKNEKGEKESLKSRADTLSLLPSIDASVIIF